jgi:hypothetical protein
LLCCGKNGWPGSALGVIRFGSGSGDGDGHYIYLSRARRFGRRMHANNLRRLLDSVLGICYLFIVVVGACICIEPAFGTRPFGRRGAL